MIAIPFLFAIIPGAIYLAIKSVRFANQKLNFTSKFLRAVTATIIYSIVYVTILTFFGFGKSFTCSDMNSCGGEGEFWTSGFVMLGMIAGLVVLVSTSVKSIPSSTTISGDRKN